VSEVSEVLSVWGCCSSLFPSSAICLAPVSRMTIVFCDQPRHCLCCVDTHTHTHISFIVKKKKVRVLLILAKFCACSY
jgi:hypothetical protein